MLNQLARYSPTDPNAIVDDAAGSWEVSAGGKVWTFRLKNPADGIKLHNGASLTSTDAVFSLGRILTPSTGITMRPAVQATLQGYIQSIQAPDDQTLLINTKFPAPSLVANLASVRAALYPRGATEALSPPSMAGPCQVIGSGPFKCKQFTPDVSLSLEKFANYFARDTQGGSLPYLDAMSFYVIPDSATRLAALRTAQVLLLPTGIDAPNAASLPSTNPDISVQQVTGTTALTVIMNTTAPPWNDIRVRSAVNLMVDRAAAAPALSGTRGDLMPPGGRWALPPAILAAQPGYGDKAAERLQAKQLLAEAGFPNGLPATLTTRVAGFTNGATFQQAADLVAAQLAPDIAVTVEVNDVATWAAKLTGKTYKVAIDTAGQQLDDPDIMFSGEYSCGAPQNYTGLCDSQMDTLFGQQQTEFDPIKRAAIVQQLTLRAMSQKAFVALTWPRAYVPVFKIVAGFQASPTPIQNTRWQEVWLNFPPPSAASTRFNPTLIGLAVGGSRTVTVEVSGLPAGGDAVQINIQHPSFLTVAFPACVGILSGGTPVAPAPVRGGTLIGPTPQPTPTATPAPVPVTGGTLIGCFLLNGNVSSTAGQVMTFVLTRTGPGTATLTMGTSGGFPTQFADNGNPIGPGTTNSLQVIEGTTVSGKVTLQGRTATFPTSVGYSISTVTLTPGNIAANAAADGSFQIQGVTAGTYTITASAPGYLSAQKASLVVASTPVTLPEVQLRAGLVNSDSVVSILDISATVASFGTSPANRLDPQGRFVDQNGDGFANIQDVSLVVSGFGMSSPQTWP